MHQEVLFKNSIGSLFAIQDNFLYLKYAENIELQKSDYEIFILYFSEYAAEHGKFALIVEIPDTTSYNKDTLKFITERQYQGKLANAIALVGKANRGGDDLVRYLAHLENVTPTKVFPSFIKAFQWLQQYVA